MDIVERLREFVGQYLGNANLDDELNEAADEIERLREALQKINKRNPFHNACPPMDQQYYAQMIFEMVNIANVALKEKE
jgi:hypothetical protein